MKTQVRKLIVAVIRKSSPRFPNITTESYENVKSLVIFYVLTEESSKNHSLKIIQYAYDSKIDGVIF